MFTNIKRSEGKTCKRIMIHLPHQRRKAIIAYLDLLGFFTKNFLTIKNNTKQLLLRQMAIDSKLKVLNVKNVFFL